MTGQVAEFQTLYPRLAKFASNTQISTFEIQYPNLAKFANSGTYIRTRRGKKEIVRKGKRKKKKLHPAVKAGLIAAGIAGVVLSPAIISTLRTSAGRQSFKKYVGKNLLPKKARHIARGGTHHTARTRNVRNRMNRAMNKTRKRTNTKNFKNFDKAMQSGDTLYL